MGLLQCAVAWMNARGEGPIAALRARLVPSGPRECTDLRKCGGPRAWPLLIVPPLIRLARATSPNVRAFATVAPRRTVPQADEPGHPSDQSRCSDLSWRPEPLWIADSRRGVRVRRIRRY